MDRVLLCCTELCMHLGSWKSTQIFTENSCVLLAIPHVEHPYNSMNYAKPATIS